MHKINLNEIDKFEEEQIIVQKITKVKKFKDQNKKLSKDKKHKRIDWDVELNIK